MPRHRQPLAPWIAVVVICALVPPAVRKAALAASAGTLFEAIPFVLAAALPPRGRVARAFGVLGCGCEPLGPGALSLPAAGLCWFAFGPAVALLRAAAAAVLRLIARNGPHGRRERPDGAAKGGPLTDAPDPLRELAGLAPQALAGALVAESLRAALPPGVLPPVAAIFAGFVGGALLGWLTPCATGAVAIAAGLRSVAPAASVGILLTAGIVSRRYRPPARALRSGRSGYALLALACALLAYRGPSGFINPRFVVPLGGAALVAALLAVRPRARTAARCSAAIPALLVAATVAGSPLPDRAPVQTTLDEPYAGEPLRFTGALARHDAGQRQATLVRYTITCCRADAEARAVRLDRPLRGAAGTWYEANGTLALDPGGAYVLHVASVRPLPPPADPFAYR